MKSNQYENLYVQADKLRRHNNQGSYKIRERYFEAFTRFLWCTAEKYKLQKLVNIHTKHLASYVRYMQDSGLAAATIKTDLAAIRFWHDKISDPRYTLPDNSAFDLERRRFGGVDRTWTDEELEEILIACKEANRADYAACLLLARYAGLRIHEALRIDTATANRALKSGQLTVKGKSGRWRVVPIDTAVRAKLEYFVAKTQPGHKLFVPADKPTHIAKAELQNCIINEGEASLTIHGFRHTYAKDQYEHFREIGLTDQGAKRRVSELIGHNRPDVTEIYLAGVER